jgi:hypothetical protein
MLPSPPDPLPAEEIFQHEKPGIRHYLILKTLPTLPRQVPSRPYIDEMDRILSGLYHIQLQAAALETRREHHQAAQLYNQLVAAAFDDPHAYFRLCRYYQNQNNPSEVARVCQAYIHMTQTLNSLGYRQPYRDELAQTFQEIMQSHEPAYP